MIAITGGLVVDGSGRPACQADVLVEDGRILDIGRFSVPAGARRIDARGLAVAPGFIDFHGHSDLQILRDPKMEAKVRQGITTEIGGNCGIGVFPVEDPQRIDKALLTDILGPWGAFGWKDYASYKEAVRGPYSLLMLQSHSMLRFNAMEGGPNRPASPEEVRRMERLLEASMDQGCLGLSTGLFYAPCAYASREELLALSRVVARRGGLLAVHQRCEGSEIISSLDEIIGVAEEAGARLQVSHLKIIGDRSQDLLGQVVRKLEGCRCLAGFDQYPYNYGTTSLSSLLPPSVLALDADSRRQALGDEAFRKAAISQIRAPRGWDSIVSLVGPARIYVENLEACARYNDMSLEEIGLLRGQDPCDALLDILAQETGSPTMVDVTETEETMMAIYRHRLGVFGTDALYNGRPTHPRSFAAAPKALERTFLRKAGVSLEEAVHRMTGRPAARAGLGDRGLVRRGLRADLAVFDPARVADTGTRAEPDRGPRGMAAVLIGGEVAWEIPRGEERGEGLA